ncbi:MAG: hypothetical protein ACPGYY_02010 [Bacteroidia bacterium]
MKKTTLLVALLLTFTTALFAQNIQREKVEFGLIQYPSEPLEGLAGHNMSITTPYPENTDNVVNEAKRAHEEALADHPNKVAEAKLKHEEDMANYDKRVQDARDNYKMEMEEWNKMGKIEKVAMKENMPRLSLPRKPTYYEPRPPVYREPNLSNVITYSNDMLKQSYLAIEGITPSTETENVLIGKVQVGEFESQSPQRKSRVESYYDKTAKATKKRTVYYYETTYKRPVFLDLSYNGKILHSGVFGTTNDYITRETASSPSLVNLERESLTAALEGINGYMNDKYGFPVVIQQSLISYVKNKKGVYDDIEGAKDFALAGIDQFKNNEMNENLQGAYEGWQAVYAEAETDNKKARVNAKVAKALLYNLMLIARMTNNIEDCNKFLAELEKMKPNYNDKVWIKEYKAQILSIEARLKANGML